LCCWWEGTAIVSWCCAMGFNTTFFFHQCVCMCENICVYVCVCLCVRERERKWVCVCDVGSKEEWCCSDFCCLQRVLIGGPIPWYVGVGTTNLMIVAVSARS
jgi:hypothetical protein